MGCKAGSGLRRKVCVIYDCLPVSRSCSGTRCCVRSRRARGPRTVRLDDGSAGDPLPRPRPGPEPADTGLLLSLGRLGGIVGGVLSGRLSRLIGSARIIWVSVGVFGLIPILMPLTERGPRLVLFPIALAGLTFTFVVYNIAQLSYRQLICPPDLLGRMNAAIRWIVWGTLPLGGLIGGALGSTTRHPGNALDRRRVCLDGGAVAVLLAAAEDARHSRTGGPAACGIRRAGPGPRLTRRAPAEDGRARRARAAPRGQLPPSPRVASRTRTIVATANTPWPITTDIGKCRSGGTVSSPGLPSGPGKLDSLAAHASLGVHASRGPRGPVAGRVMIAAGGLIGPAR